MNPELARILFTYLIATFVVVAGLWYLFIARQDPPASQSTNLVVAGFIGATLQYVFGGRRVSG